MLEELKVCDSVYAGNTGVIPEDAELAAALMPDEDAVTVKVYSVPFVKPVTVIGEELPVTDMFPGDEVTV
jgi:hypothetical protein